MSFKTVMMAVPASAGDGAVDRAAAIADALGAHLHLLVVGVAPPPPSSPYGIVSNDIWASEIREGQEVAQACGETLLEKLGARGISASVEPQYVDRGTIAALAARAARYADLTLIAPAATDGGDPMQTWVMDGALFESGRPVLLLPPGEAAFPRAERIVIAWDASVEASKAVRDALGLMKAAREVHAVLIDPVPSFDGHGPEPGADLGAYLARHGIHVTVHRLPRQGREAADIINQTAADVGADLIVMGGFGHSRLRQRIFGGTTTSMIRSARIPVLMAH
jgi:nucleotide-binding universal stress UspA family protein